MKKLSLLAAMFVNFQAAGLEVRPNWQASKPKSTDPTEKHVERMTAARNKRAKRQARNIRNARGY